MLFMDIYRSSYQCMIQHPKYLLGLVAVAAGVLSLKMIFGITTDVGLSFLSLIQVLVTIGIVIAVHRLVGLGESRINFSWVRFFRYLFLGIAILIVVMVPVIIFIASLDEDLLSNPTYLEWIVATTMGLLSLCFILYLPAVAIGTKPIDRTIFFISVKNYLTLLLALGPVLSLYSYVPTMVLETPIESLFGVLSGVLCVLDALLLSTAYKVLILEQDNDIAGDEVTA